MNKSESVKEYWKKKTKEERAEHARMMSLKRWSGTTKEERKEEMRKVMRKALEKFEDQ